MLSFSAAWVFEYDCTGAPMTYADEHCVSPLRKWTLVNVDTLLSRGLIYCSRGQIAECASTLKRGSLSHMYF
jgi:hypothetical protein